MCHMLALIGTFHHSALIQPTTSVSQDLDSFKRVARYQQHPSRFLFLHLFQYSHNPYNGDNKPKSLRKDSRSSTINLPPLPSSSHRNPPGNMESFATWSSHSLLHALQSRVPKLQSTSPRKDNFISMQFPIRRF